MLLKLSKIVIFLVFFSFFCGCNGSTSPELQLTRVIASLNGNGYTDLMDLFSNDKIVSTLNLGDGRSKTIFAPTNDALNSISAANRADVTFISDLLSYHIVPSYLPSAKIVYDLSAGNNATNVATQLGDDYLLAIRESPILNFSVNGVGLNHTDMVISGLTAVHGINRILSVPKSPNAATLETTTAVEQLTKTGEHTTFLSFLENADIVAKLNLSDGSKKTIFAPTDDAFSSLPQSVESLLDDVAQAIKILSYHIVPSYLPLSKLNSILETDGNSTVVNTLRGAGQMINISLNGENIYANEYLVGGPNVEATSRAAIHSVDGVLLPEHVRQTAAGKEEFEKLEASVNVFGFGLFGRLIGNDEVASALNLSDGNPMTIFVPTDDAFFTLGLTDSQLSDVDFVVNLLSYHIAPSRLTSDEISAVFDSDNNVTAVTTSLGADYALSLTRNSTAVYVDGVQIDKFDLVRSSLTALHSIDKVLTVPSVPNGGIVDLNVLRVQLGATGEHSTLVRLLNNSAIVSALNLTDGKPKTIFAPTDDAFYSLPQVVQRQLDDTELDIEILLYNIIIGYYPLSVLSVDVGPDNAINLPTLSGSTETISVTLNGTNMYANGIFVTSPDLSTTGRVAIHTINSVLQTKEFRAKTQGADEILKLQSSLDANGFTTLRDFLENSTIVEALHLTDGNTKTIFAPTNDAFEAVGLSATNYPSLDYIVNLLSYHISPSYLPESTLNATFLARSNVTTVATSYLEDYVLYAEQNSTGIFVEDAKVSQMNLVQSGVTAVHGIEQVLTIPSVPNAGTVDLKVVTVQLESTGKHNTLVNYLKKSEVISALNLTSGSLKTMFAPTDNAFLSLPQLIQRQLDESDLEIEILLYHIIPQYYPASRLSFLLGINTLISVPTSLGPSQNISLTLNGGSIYVNQVRVSVTDVATAGRTAVHSIDSVLESPKLSKAESGQEELLKITLSLDANGFTTFKGLLDNDTIVEALNLTDAKNKTIFAPTNAAMAAYGITDANFNSTFFTQIIQILSYHITPIYLPSTTIFADLSGSKDVTTVTTLLGANYVATITKNTTNLYVNGITVTNPDLVRTKTTSMHGIGGVLIPFNSSIPLNSVSPSTPGPQSLVLSDTESLTLSPSPPPPSRAVRVSASCAFVFSVFALFFSGIFLLGC